LPNPKPQTITLFAGLLVN